MTMYIPGRAATQAFSQISYNAYSATRTESYGLEEKADGTDRIRQSEISSWARMIFRQIRKTAAGIWPRDLEEAENIFGSAHGAMALQDLTAAATY